MKRVLAVLALAGSLSCVSTHFERTGFDAPPARPPGPCSAVVLEQPPTDRKYVEIGICMTSVPGGGMISDNTPDAIRELKVCACQNGGNAILLKGDGEAGGVGRFGYSQQRVKARGTVLLVSAKD